MSTSSTSWRTTNSSPTRVGTRTLNTFGGLDAHFACSDVPVALQQPSNRRATSRNGLVHLELGPEIKFPISNREIAMSFGISYETVKEHVQQVLRKIGVNDRTQAAVWAVRKGIV